MAAVFIVLFIIGFLFLNAAQVTAWVLGEGKPTEPHWKTYASIGVSIWLLLFILANILL